MSDRPSRTVVVVDVRTEDVIEQLASGADPRVTAMDWLSAEYGAARDWLLAGFDEASDEFDGDAVLYVRPVGARP